MERRKNAKNCIQKILPFASLYFSACRHRFRYGRNSSESRSAARRPRTRFRPRRIFQNQDRPEQKGAGAAHPRRAAENGCLPADLRRNARPHGYPRPRGSGTPLQTHPLPTGLQTGQRSVPHPLDERRAGGPGTSRHRRRQKPHLSRRFQ